MSKRNPAGFRCRRQSLNGHEGADYRQLDAVGRSGETALTAFTGGCPELLSILADSRPHPSAVSRLVSHWNETSASEANCPRSVARQSIACGSEGCDRRGSRLPTLAAVERQSH
jgi:hypothetical protein